MSQDFLLLVFSWISFPQAPGYTKSAVSNFFKNSRRYSKLKVHHRCHWHRWQIEKIFNQKSFHYFFWTPLGSRVSIYIIFFFKLILICQQFDDCSHCLPPVSFTPVANLPPASLITLAICRQYRWHRWQIKETGGKICVVTSGNFAAGCRTQPSRVHDKKKCPKLPLLCALGCHTRLDKQHCPLRTYDGISFKGGKTLWGPNPAFIFDEYQRVNKALLRIQIQIWLGHFIWFMIQGNQTNLTIQ